jgi:hypothetical protein
VEGRVPGINSATADDRSGALDRVIEDVIRPLSRPPPHDGLPHPDGPYNSREFSRLEVSKPLRQREPTPGSPRPRRVSTAENDFWPEVQVRQDRDSYDAYMTTSQRLIVALTSLLLTFIVVWVAFFDGPRALILSALALCGVLLLAWFSRKWREQPPSRGTSQH